MANDNFRMVPRSQLPEVGTISGDGEVTFTRDLAFDRHCIANDVDPAAWRAAIKETQARWRRSAVFEAMRTASGKTSGVEEAQRR